MATFTGETLSKNQRLLNVSFFYRNGITEVHGVMGESTTVPVKVDNTGLLAGGHICIAYDPEVLSAADVSSDPSILLVSNIAEPGLIRIVFAESNGLANRVLAAVQFDIIADDVSPLTLQRAEFYRPDLLPMDPIRLNGRFISWAIPPERSALLQNFPNPFNPETWIPYQLKEDSKVTIRVYSVPGELVRELELGYRSAGLYVSRDRAAYWNGKNEAGEYAASGIYFYNIQAGNLTATRKMAISE